ncbi:unnamed protein product [Sphagnum jensenii]
MKSASRSPIFGGVMLALIEGAGIMLDRVAGGRSLQTLTEHLLSLPPAPITANYHHPQRFFSCSKYRMIFALRYRSSSAQAPPRYSCRKFAARAQKKIEQRCLDTTTTTLCGGGGHRAREAAADPRLLQSAQGQCRTRAAAPALPQAKKHAVDHAR